MQACHPNPVVRPTPLPTMSSYLSGCRVSALEKAGSMLALLLFLGHSVGWQAGQDHTVLEHNLSYFLGVGGGLGTLGLGAKGPGLGVGPGVGGRGGFGSVVTGKSVEDQSVLTWWLSIVLSSSTPEKGKVNMLRLVDIILFEGWQSGWIQW